MEYNQNGCTKCNNAEGFALKQINGIGRCIEFHHCKQINFVLGRCQQCEDGFIDVDGFCTNYANCKERESGVCVICESGYKLIDGMCIKDLFCASVDGSGKCTKCLNGYEYDSKNNKCISCLSGYKCYVTPKGVPERPENAKEADIKQNGITNMFILLVILLTLLF